MKVCRRRDHHLDAGTSIGYETFGDCRGSNACSAVAEQLVRRSAFLREPTVRETGLHHPIQEPNRIETAVEVRGSRNLYLHPLAVLVSVDSS